jgi:hypothetical protein
VTHSDGYIERRKMFVGPIEGDQVMSLKIGDKLVITTDLTVEGTKGIISVKNCFEFPPTLVK